MTSLAEAESIYGQLVQCAGVQIFGIERPALFSRGGEKLKIGVPDGFVKMDVRLNQPNIDLVCVRQPPASSNVPASSGHLRIQPLAPLLCHPP